jgi:DNA polymerase III delta subunit
LLTNTG